GDLDPASGGRVPGGVLEQVVDDLVDAGGISGHAQIGGLDVDDPASVAALGRQGGGVDHLVEEGRQRDLLQIQLDDARVEAGQVQQVLDQQGEPLGLGQGDRQRGRIRLGDPVHDVLQL